MVDDDNGHPSDVTVDTETPNHMFTFTYTYTYTYSTGGEDISYIVSNELPSLAGSDNTYFLEIFIRQRQTMSGG